MHFILLTTRAPVLQWCWNSKAQGWFLAKSNWNWLAESIFGKYNSFYELNKLFSENKTTETLVHGYTYTGMHTHAQALCTYASCICTHTRACIHMLGFQKLERQVFYALKLGFGTNLTSFRSCSKPPFFNYIKSYMVPFQNTQKILRENTRFTKNSESKREFFTKHPQVNIFLIKAFSSLDLRVSSLLITFVFYYE